MATTAFNSDLTAQAAGFTTLTVGSGSAIAKVTTATASVDFASMGANAQSVQTVAVSGAAAGDTVVHQLGSNWSLDYLNIAVVSQVTAAGVVALSASNKSAGTINPDATTVRVTVFSF